MLLKDQDIKLGLVTILFGAFYLTQALKLSGSAGLFPMALLYLIMLSGVLIILRAVIRIKKGKEYYHRMSFRQFMTDTGIPGGVLLIACLLLNVLGFYVCSLLIILFVSLIQHQLINGTWNPGRRRLVGILLFSLGSTAFMYLCFSILLSLPTPRGIFGW